MGVQKSRKSTRHTKYSLKLIKILKLNNTLTMSKLAHIYARNKFQKTQHFNTTNRKSETTLFFNSK
jgi:hypothetical protein